MLLQFLFGYQTVCEQFHYIDDFIFFVLVPSAYNYLYGRDSLCMQDIA